MAGGRKGSRILRTIKHHIPALDIGHNFLKPKPIIKGLQVGHQNNVPAANVKRAKKGNVSGHAGFYTEPLWSGLLYLCHSDTRMAFRRTIGAPTLVGGRKS